MQHIFEKHQTTDYNLRFQTDFVLRSVLTQLTLACIHYEIFL